ncbi:hypothetical protein AAG906_032594 [Vitis piasezkii]
MQISAHIKAQTQAQSQLPQRIQISWRIYSLGCLEDNCNTRDDEKELAAKDEDGRKVVGGGSKSKGEKSAAKKSKLESGDEVIKGDNAPSREKSKIPMK